MSFKNDLDENLKSLAKSQIHKYEYWFRKKYNLSPHDPRYLECEPWEFEFEYEIERASDDEEEALRNSCPHCGSVVYGNYCFKCKKPVPTEKYYDPNFDEYFDEVEKENEEYFASLNDKNQWVEDNG